MSLEKAFEKKVEKLNLRKGAKHHHIFLCGGPKCCGEETGQKVWEHLKEKVRDPKYNGIMRTRATCLRLCLNGPIALVYPEGCWFSHVDEKKLDNLLDVMASGNSLVSDDAFAHVPLTENLR